MKFSESLKKNYEFRRLYAKGKSAGGQLLVVYARRTHRRVNKLGITVSSKIGNAVVRNLIRRRLKEIYRLNEDKFSPGLELVVVARQKSREASYRELERDFLRTCTKLGLLAPVKEKSL